MDLSFCNISWANAPLLLDLYNDIPRFVLGATLLALAVTQTLKQSVDMYKATKQWQPNLYMKLFARDGTIYFIVYVMLSPLLSFPFIPITGTFSRLSYPRVMYKS